MKEHNTLTLKELIIRTALSFIIVLILFSLFIFKTIPGCTLTQSKLILGILIIISLGLLYFEKDHRRNNLSVAINTLLPFGLYTTIAYMTFYTLPLALLWGILIVLDIVYIGIYVYKVKNRDYCALLEKTHMVLGLGSLVAIIIVLSSTLFGSSLITASTSSTHNTETVIREYDTKALKNFKDWNKLTRKQKLNTLQTICNHERDYLGISEQIKVGAGEGLTHPYAQYKHKSEEIIIDLNQLDNASSNTLLEALLHNIYHAYEHSLVDSYNSMNRQYTKLLDYRKIAIYKEEFSVTVTNKAVNFNQINETDAKAYGASALVDYKKQLNKIK